MMRIIQELISVILTKPNKRNLAAYIALEPNVRNQESYEVVFSQLFPVGC